MARVHDEIGRLAERCEQTTLRHDPVGQRPIARHRVYPPGLGIAPRDHVIRTVEEQHLDGRVDSSAQRRDVLRELCRIEIPGPNIDPDREPPPRCRALVNQGRHEAYGKVVDGLAVHVLERLERRRAAGTRKTRHHEHTARK